MVNIAWTSSAIRDLEKIDKSVAKRIIRRISWLSDHFGSITPEPLSGEFRGAYKFRIGDWRVINTIEGQALTIQMIGHRKEIYKIG